MKKINGMIILLLATIISFGGIGFTSKVEASNNKPSVSAHAYVVMESKTGQVLLSQDENKKIYPASTVKMMTALIALENGNLSKRITITNQHLKNIPSDATMVGIKVGSTYTLDELMHMLLIYSGADAAQVIAYDIAGSPDEFIKLMNKKEEREWCND